MSKNRFENIMDAFDDQEIADLPKLIMDDLAKMPEDKELIVSIMSGLPKPTKT